VARNNLERAGLAARVGPALETLSQIETAGFAPFDLILIDPDKANNAHYLVWALQLARLGSVIIGDNVIRNGAVPDVESSDASVQGIRRFFDKRPPSRA
jgi:predicted O-methyltransferase YrrM